MLLRKFGFTYSNNSQAVSAGRGSRYARSWMALRAMLAAQILGPKCRASAEESDEGGGCFRDVLVEFLSCHSTRYCNGVRSFINQAHKYPKQSTTYGRENSIVLLHFIVINQHMVLQRNAGFKCQALKTPKVNLTGISLQNVAISISN